jgi:hypothetical protein
MQSLALTLFVLTAPRLLGAQDAAGTQLWRLAGGTVPVPLALATGVAGLWNPAQPESLSVAALELIQTPATIGVAGFLGGIRVRVGRLGRFGMAYGRIAMRDLVRTSLSPDPDGAPVQYYTHTARGHWSRGLGRATVGAALAFHETRLDESNRSRMTFDIGARYQVGSHLLLAAATHFFSGLAASPAQDVFGAAELRLWSGTLWSGSGLATVRLRYGISAANRLGTDHHLGTGIDIGGAFAADFEVVREAGYAGATWRPIGGIQFRVGRYRIVFAGDAGPRQVGAAYRVGLEARLR